MALFSSFNIASSGMTAQRLRMDVISENIANVKTTRTNEGGAYIRKNVVLNEKGNNYGIRTFSYYAFLPLDVNDYTDYLGERYWLTLHSTRSSASYNKRIQSSSTKCKGKQPAT